MEHISLPVKYCTPQINDAISLFEGNLTCIVEMEGREVPVMAGTGQVVLRWFPDPHIAFELAYDSQNPVMLNQGLPVHAKVLRAVVEETTTQEPKVYTGQMKGNLRKNLILADNEGQLISALLFSLANFPPRRVESRPLGEAIQLVPELEIEWDEWTLGLAPVVQSEVYDRLRDEGGYAITYAGVVQHRNGQPFPESDAEQVLRLLRGFFNFVRGFRCGPLLPIGFDEQQQECWQKWEDPTVVAWNRVGSWVDAEHPEWLAELLPGFARRWDDALWGETVGLALYWYVECNSIRNAEGSIIIVQAALERLAYVCLVQETKQLTSKQFKGRRADEKLRLLLAHFGIPTEIPPHLPHLLSLATQENWSDGPKTWIELRNNIVHPEHRWEPGFSSIPVAVMEDLLNLGMWYLELVLLALFGYSGEYHNRLRREVHLSRIERVPWAQAAEVFPHGEDLAAA